jgi:hypothetical protein
MKLKMPTKKQAFAVASAGALVLAYILLNQTPGAPLWFITLNNTYTNASANLSVIAFTSPVLTKLQDINVSITVNSNGTVNLHKSQFINDSNYVLVSLFNLITWQFNCVSTSELRTLTCPGNFTSIDDMGFKFYSQELNKSTTDQENFGLTFLIPINMDNSTGKLISYNLSSTPDVKTITAQLNSTHAIALPRSITYSVDAVATYKTIKCLEVVLPRWCNTQLNITMPNKITTYTYPIKYLDKLNQTGNNLFITFIPYRDMTNEVLEVCS